MTKHIYTSADAHPALRPGDVLAVHHGDYRRQEIWIVCGSNIGNIYPLGSPYGNAALRDPTVPEHPHWEDVVRRGPVTLLVAGRDETYRSGWRDGRKRMREQIESLDDDAWDRGTSVAEVPT